MLFTSSLPTQTSSPQAIFTGSLFNRKALCQKLLISLESSIETILLQAFQKWGTKCLAELDGEFIFAISIPQKNIIFCARDRLGTTPFYYYNLNNTFIVSDEISEVVKIAKKNGLTQNLGFIAEYLSQNIYSTDDTIYLEIKKLPASHSILIENNSFSIKKYYSPKANAKQGSPEQLKQILKQACLKRIPDSQEPAIYLSGGIDSSCLLALLKETHSKQTHAFSMEFPGNACDEREYIEMLESSFNHNQYWCEPEEVPSVDLDQMILQHADLPGFANNIFSTPLLNKVNELGLKTVLSGVGGDELFTGGYCDYLYLLKNLEFSRLCEQCKRDPRIYSYASNLTPQFVKQVFQQKKLTPTWIPNFFHSSFVEKSAIHERLKNKNEFNFKTSLQKQKILHATFSGLAQLGLEQNYRNANFHKLRHTHPFLDTKVLEFCLAIPDQELKKGSMKKHFLRQAFKNKLPTSIATRKDKANFSYIFPKLIESFGGKQAFEGLTLYDEKILEPKAVMNLYDSIQGKDKQNYHHSSYQLWAILAVEGVYRNLF